MKTTKLLAILMAAALLLTSGCAQGAGNATTEPSTGAVEQTTADTTAAAEQMTITVTETRNESGGIVSATAVDQDGNEITVKYEQVKQADGTYEAVARYYAADGSEISEDTAVIKITAVESVTTTTKPVTTTTKKVVTTTKAPVAEDEPVQEKTTAAKTTAAKTTAAKTTAAKTTAATTTKKVTTTKATTTTKAPASCWDYPPDPAGIRRECKAYAESIGMTWDETLDLTNSHWITPNYCTPYFNGSDLKVSVREAVSHYAESGYEYINIVIQKDPAGDYAIYKCVG